MTRQQIIDSGVIPESYDPLDEEHPTYTVLCEAPFAELSKATKRVRREGAKNGTLFDTYNVIGCRKYPHYKRADGRHVCKHHLA